MSVRNPSVGIDVKDSDGQQIGGTTFAASASTNSKWYSLDNAKYVGVAIASGTITGTSTVMTVTPQVRFGGQADIYDLPIAVNDETAATITTWTTGSDDTNRIKYFENPLPVSGQKGQFRLNFEVSGTNPSVPVDQCVLWKVAR